MEIDEFDMENEVDIGFGYYARLIFDNKTLTDVLTTLRQVAVNPYTRAGGSGQGFLASIVTYSTAQKRILEPIPGPAPECTSAYGDSAFLLPASRLRYAMQLGGTFGGEGIDWYKPGSGSRGLPCHNGQPITNPQELPVSYAEPLRTLDVHVHVCIGGDGSGAFYPGAADQCGSVQDCVLDNATDTDCQRFKATSTAKALFNSLNSFRSNYEHTKIRFGEANSAQRCADHVPSLARQAMDGFRESTLKPWSSNIFFTAWNTVHDDTIKPCNVTPTLLTPYNPFAP